MKKFIIWSLVVMMFFTSIPVWAVSDFSDVTVVLSKDNKTLIVKGSTSNEAIAVFVYNPSGNMIDFKTLLLESKAFEVLFENVKVDVNGTYKVKLANYSGGPYTTKTFDVIVSTSPGTPTPQPTTERVTESDVEPTTEAPKSTNSETKTNELVDKVKQLLSSTPTNEDLQSRLVKVQGIIDEVSTLKIGTSERDLLNAASVIENALAVIKSLDSDMNLKNLEKKITLVSETNGSGTITLPPLVEVFKKVDKVAIETPMGTLTFSKNSFEGVSTGTEVLINKVDEDQLAQDLKSKNVISYELRHSDKKIETFNEPITIYMPYDIKDGENVKQITAFHLDENGLSTPMVGRYENGFYIFTTPHFSMFYIGVNPVKFDDVQASHWAYDAISELNAKGVLKGNAKGKINAENPVTRAEFITLISRVMNLGNVYKAELFTDVNSSDWYYNDVCKINAKGILNGLYTTKLNPNEYVTRWEMAVLVGRVLEVYGYNGTGEKALDVFSDQSALPTENGEDVSIAVTHGLIKGVNGAFEPTNILTRAQAAMVISRLIEKVIE